MQLLGSNGVHGVSHPRVDDHAGVPAGTASFYFRTRKALLHAVATRLAELDVADFSRMAELADDPSAQFTGTAGLARIVMYVNTEPWLTRAKARYELALLAGRDAELADILDESVTRLNTLARDVVTQWHPAASAPDPALVADQAIATLALINGIMLTFVAGQPAVDSAEHLDRLIRGVIAGVAAVRGE
ncbi:TetR/AcrR family transcriptional regulator [Mycobacterium sp. E2989]|uniref:TetR/AcrR family transcriptional regulator n=1 Tax=Mycobacterium sp. E2989 TaxID=1834140 RepID=UPI0035133D7F